MSENRTAKPWTLETVKRLTIELNPETDADVIKQLESRDSVREYLLRLVREDIGKQAGASIPGNIADAISNAEKNFGATLELLKRVVSK